MREQEFRQWARTQRYAERSVSTLVYDAKRTERDEGVDLDAEFEKDGLKSLIRLYSPTAQDERDGKIPKMKVTSKHKDKSLFDIFYGYRHTLKKYSKFCLSTGDDFVNEDEYDEIDTDKNVESELEIKLQEDQLQDMMRQTIAELEDGLKIIDDGMERHVASGFIDILAQDKDGCFVVIELKVGQAPNSVIAQTLGYMVDIAESNGKEFKQVRGIIVASNFNKRVETAARALPNLKLKTYKHRFEFN